MTWLNTCCGQAGNSADNAAGDATGSAARAAGVAAIIFSMELLAAFPVDNILAFGATANPATVADISTSLVCALLDAVAGNAIEIWSGLDGKTIFPLVS